MSRESRDGRKPHESDDDARSNYSADENDRNTRRRAIARRVPRLGAVASTRSRASQGPRSPLRCRVSRGARAPRPHSHRESSEGRRAFVVRRRGRGNAAPPRPPIVRRIPTTRTIGRTITPAINPTSTVGDRAADPAKFASYDDEPESSRSDDDGYVQEPQAKRLYRAEPAHRPHRDLRAGAPREGDCWARGQHRASKRPRRGGPRMPIRMRPRTRRPRPIEIRPISGGGLHPYDQTRAIMIGLSTALVAAIGIIVALMFNLSWHKGPASSPPRRIATRRSIA